MEKNRTMSKIVSMLVLVGMTITLTVGCANKTASTSVQNKAVYAQNAAAPAQSSSQGDNTANNTGNANNTSNGTAKTDGASSITTLFSNTLKSLVSDGTITQTQADAINQKIQESLKSSMPSQSRQYGQPGQNGQNTQPSPNEQNNQNTQNSQGSQNL